MVHNQGMKLGATNSECYVVDWYNFTTGHYRTRTADYGLRTADYGLRTTDCGLRTGYEMWTRHYGLGVKYGLGYKTRTEHYGLRTKRGLSIADSVQNTDSGMNSRLDYQPLLGK